MKNLARQLLIVFLSFAITVPSAMVFPAPAFAAEGERTWTVNFRDSDILEVIKFVADATGKTVVVDPRVKGRVQVISAEPLTQQDLYSLFLSVLEIQGFTAIESGNIVRVIPNKEARSSPAPVSDRVSRVDDEFTTQVISLKNVSAAKVLPVLRPLVPQQSHLAAYEPGNAIIIADTAANIARILALIEKIDKAAVEGTDVVELKYAQADEMVRIISELYPQNSSPNSQESWLLVGDQRTNSVLVKGPDIDRDKIKRLIRRMDRPGPQSGNVRVVYLEYAKAESLSKVLTNIVNNTQQGDQKKPGSVKASVEADEDTNALLITAEGDTLNTLLSVVERLDIRRAQVLVEAIIVEMEDIAGRDLGIQWLFQDKHGVYGSSSDATSNANILGAVSGAALGDDDDELLTNLAGALSNIPGQTLGFGRVRDDLSFNVLLNALQEDTGANILSTPNLLTMDNSAASIMVGQNVPFVTGSFSSTGNGSGVTNPFQTIQRENVGITLEVTPHINEGDSVVLDIAQEVSSLSGATNINASDIITNERKITTQILADDGEIVVLGGLIKDDVQEFKRRVPVLGSLPLLGALFRSTSTSVVKTNLLVFIRATVIRDNKEMSGATAEKYRYIRDQQLAKRDRGVSWLADDRLPVLPEWKEHQERKESAPQQLIVPETLLPEEQNEESVSPAESLQQSPPLSEAPVSLPDEETIEPLVVEPPTEEPPTEEPPEAVWKSSARNEKALYTVQLAALSTFRELEEYLSNPYLEGLELNRYTTETENGSWHVVTWGGFSSYAEAKAAWQRKAEDYPALNVWIRSTGPLQFESEMVESEMVESEMLDKGDQ